MNDNTGEETPAEDQDEELDEDLDSVPGLWLFRLLADVCAPPMQHTIAKTDAEHDAPR
jgi:hypothetical protein